MRQERQRIRVTGAAGFVGSALSGHLGGARSALEVVPPPEDGPRRRPPALGLARERLGWEPRVDSDAGLAATAAGDVR
jgi:nucleoside-diphosphate-sugar epimerase